MAFGRLGSLVTLVASFYLLWQVWTLLILGGGLQSSGAVQAAQSVVQVRHFDPLRPWGNYHGSGFVWDREGHIVTNHHVVEDSTNVAVLFTSGEECPARVVGRSPECDLAVLELVDCERPSSATPLGLSWLWPRVGDRVATFGRPGAWSPMLTEGVVAAVGREAPWMFQWWEMRGGMRRFLQTCDVDGLVLSTVTVSQGSSGGPLLSSRGNVVGLSTWRFAGGFGHPRVTAAISTWVLRRVVPRLLEDGEFVRPVVGIERRMGPARMLVDEHAAVYPSSNAILPSWSWSLLGLRAQGCRLWRLPTEEAQEAGLRRLDEVIRLGWRRVQTVEDAMVAIQRAKPNTSLWLTYRRPGDYPGYVRRSSIKVYAGPPSPTRRSTARRWLKRGTKAFLAMRLVKAAADDDLNLRGLMGQSRGPVRQTRRFTRWLSRSAANAGDSTLAVVRPRGPVRWVKNIVRNINFDFLDFQGWPRIWRFPGQFTFFDSGHFKFGRSHEDGAHVAG